MQEEIAEDVQEDQTLVEEGVLQVLQEGEGEGVLQVLREGEGEGVPQVLREGEGVGVPPVLQERQGELRKQMWQGVASLNV